MNFGPYLPVHHITFRVWRCDLHQGRLLSGSAL